MATDMSRLSLALTDTTTRAAHMNVEVHTVDTSRRIIFHAKIDVLADAEAEVASLGEILVAKFVLLNFETPLENLSSLLAANGDMARDLLITANSEGTDGVTS